MTKAEETHVEARQFSVAEIARLKAKADAANTAIAEYHDWLDFLRQQHEAKEEEGWQLGAQGFVRAAKNESLALPAPTAPPNGDGGQEHETIHHNGVVPEKEAAALA